jgi:hypothetical protein
MVLEADPDPSRSPRERLEKIGDNVGALMLMHFAAKQDRIEH